MAFQDVKYKVYINDVFQNISRIIFVTVAILLGFKTVGVAWGWSFSIIITDLFSLYMLINIFPQLLSKEIKPVLEYRELITYSFPLLLAGISGLIMTWTDTLMLGYLTTSKDVGIYNAALPTARLISIIGGSFLAILFPVISGLFAIQKFEEIKIIYSIVTKWILIILIPIVTITVTFPERVIEVIFGSEYKSGAHALALLSFSYFLSSLFGSSVQILSAFGRTKAVMAFTFLGASANVLLNAIFIPKFGVFGAAFATGLSNVFSRFSCVLYLFYTEKMQPLKLANVKPLIASFLSMIVLYPLKFIIPINLISLLILLLLYLLLYIFLTLILRSFEREDLIVLRAIEQRLGIRIKPIKNFIQRYL